MPTKKVKRDMGFASTICYPLTMNQMKEMPMAQLPYLDQAGFMKQNQQMPMSYFGFDLGQQNVTQSQNFQGAIMPSFNSFQYSQLAAMGCGMEPNMFFGFPMVYCNEMNNLNYLPSTFFNIPMTISAQKIETIDNC